MPCLGATLVLLTPWTLPRLVLFPPVVLIFLAAFQESYRSTEARNDRMTLR